jgi:multicomponent Na+:H+ antiporter subunit A
MLVFSLYLLFAGHNQPGGGFAGGLVAGVGVLLAWAAGGTPQVRRLVPFRATVLFGLGLVLATLSAFVPLALGAGFGESAIVEFTLPPFGDVKFVSVLVFDMGVYLVVLGMSLGLIRSLGADIDVEEAT